MTSAESSTLWRFSHHRNPYHLLTRYCETIAPWIELDPGQTGKRTECRQYRPLLTEIKAGQAQRRPPPPLLQNYARVQMTSQPVVISTGLSRIMTQSKWRDPARLAMHFNIPGGRQLSTPAIMAASNQLDEEIRPAASPLAQDLGKGIHRPSAMEKITKYQQTRCPGAGKGLIKSVQGLETGPFGQRYTCRAKGTLLAEVQIGRQQYIFLLP